MTWTEDPQVWDKIDNLVLEAAPRVRDLLDSLHEHRDAFPSIIQVLLFSCLGKFVVSYHQARFPNPETGEPFHDPPLAFHAGILAVASDPAAEAMMRTAVNSVVDDKVGGLF